MHIVQFIDSLFTWSLPTVYSGLTQSFKVRIKLSLYCCYRQIVQK